MQVFGVLIIFCESVARVARGTSHFFSRTLQLHQAGYLSTQATICPAVSETAIMNCAIGSIEIEVVRQPPP